MIKHTSILSQYKSVSVWLPVITALVYFYSWLFEFIICSRLSVPTAFIELTIGSVLSFAGCTLLFTGIGIIIVFSIHITSKSKLKFVIPISVFLCLAIPNLIAWLLVHHISWPDFLTICLLVYFFGWAEASLYFIIDQFSVSN